MEAERQGRREIEEEERVGNITTTDSTGSPESSVQVVSSQAGGDVQKRKALSPISGNGIDKGIKKTRPMERKKPSEFKINESSISALISKEARQ